MAKNVLASLISSLSLLFLISCEIPPTYSRKNIETTITNICRDEYAIDVSVFDAGSTVWIYTPISFFDEEGKLRLNENKKWDDEVSLEMRRVSQSINRVLLSMDQRPDFYCLVRSSIEGTGLDWYQIVFMKDSMKFMMESFGMGIEIPAAQIREKYLQFQLENLAAIGDKTGEHITKYNMTMNEFIALLAQLRLLPLFIGEDVKDNFLLNDLFIDYSDDELKIDIDISIKKYKQGLPSPVEECEEVARQLLKEYGEYTSINKVIITDRQKDTSKSFEIEKRDYHPLSISSQKNPEKTLISLYRANFYYRAGHEFFTEGDYLKSQELFEKSVSNHPEANRAYIYLGRAYNATKDYAQATKFYEKIIENGTEEIYAYTGLSQSYLKLEEYAKAKDILDKAFIIDPGNVELRLAYVDIAFAQSEFKKALRLLKNIYNDNLKDNEKQNLYSKLGYAYVMLDSLGQGVENYHKALELAQDDKTKKSIYQAIANAYLTKKEYNQARMNYELVLGFGEGDSRVYSNLAMCFQYLGEYNKVFPNYEKALELDPDNFYANLGLAQTYNAIKDYPKSIEHYKKVQNQHSKSSSFYVEMSLPYAGLKDYQTSLDLLYKAISLDSRNALAYHRQGLVYMELNELDKSVDSLKKAVEIKSNYTHAYYALGTAYYKLKNFKESRNYFEKAKQLYLINKETEAVRKINAILQQIP